MPTMHNIETHHSVAIPPSVKFNDDSLEEEELVELFIAQANSLRHAHGLPDLYVGALGCSISAGLVRLATTKPSLKDLGFNERVIHWFDCRTA